MPKGLQDQARVAVAELGMNNPDQFTYEVINGVMRLVLLLPKDEYTLAKEGIPEEDWSDLLQLKVGTRVLLREIT